VEPDDKGSVNVADVDGGALTVVPEFGEIEDGLAF
jgi:hypothetical protein